MTRERATLRRRPLLAVLLGAAALAAPAAWARRWPPRAVGRRGRDDGVAPAPVDTRVDRVDRY